MKLCSVVGCSGKHYAKTVCKKHYRQMPDQKAYQKAYCQRPEVKAYQKRKLACKLDSFVGLAREGLEMRPEVAIKKIKARC